MAGSTEGGELDPALERDLYRALLELASADEDLEGLLYCAADVLRRFTGADSLYLQAGSELVAPARYWAAVGFASEQLQDVRATLSRTIMRTALESGEVLWTLAASDDQRFANATSVVRNEVVGVVCCALGGDPNTGVLYMQSRSMRRASPQVRRVLELFSEQVAPHVRRAERRAAALTRDDATTAARQKLHAKDIVGTSPALGVALERAALAAPLDLPVLITGPSGTGKSMLASTIARSGPRADGPFVEINCAAIPSTLITAELFGALRGSHSTASRDMPGKVEVADGGTLFLDEIGEMDPQSQAALLHFVQTKRYHRLGDTRERSANVRIIAATNIDVREAMARGALREDLYYRLAAVEIEMPALNARPEDIPAVADTICERAVVDMGLSAVSLSAEARAYLTAKAWPGNVRQLRNAVEFALVRASAAGVTAIQPEHFGAGADGSGEPEATGASLQAQTRAFQRHAIQRALAENEGNVSRAAHALGVARSHLYRLMTMLDIARS